MVKNRLSELQARAKHVDESSEMIPLSSQQNALQDIFESFGLVVEKIDGLKETVGRIHSYQNEILNSSHKRDETEALVSDLQSKAKRLAFEIKESLQNQRGKIESNDKLESRMRSTQIHAQSKRFYEIWNSYNTQQIEFRNKSKNLLVRRCKIVNSNFSEEDIENMLDEGKTSAGLFANSILDQERLARQELMDLQERHDVFLKLEKSIKEIHDMFMDISTLLASQGEIIDNIHSHVLAAEIDVEKGKKHLHSAENYAISKRKTQLCLLGVGLIIIIIILFVVLFEFDAFSSRSSSEKIIIQKIYIPTSNVTEP